MIWIRRYKPKKFISKISVDSNFTFSSYAWLCVFHCSHRLLCWIKSRVRDFSVKVAFISHWNDFSLIPLGKCSSYTKATKICIKFKLWKFWESPLFNISEYAFKGCIIIATNLCVSEYLGQKWLLEQEVSLISENATKAFQLSLC